MISSYVISLGLIGLCLSACKSTGGKGNNAVSNPAMSGEVELTVDSNMGFLATVSCDYACKNQGQKSINIMKSYGPGARGLKPGNGNMWGSLSADLQYFSDQACLEAAKSQCGSLGKIAKLHTVGIQSGQWNVALPISCRPTKNIISPFDDGGSQVQSVMMPTHDAFDEIHDATKYGPIQSCQTKIRAELCFGDCLIPEGQAKMGKWRQIIATNSPHGSRNVELCADSLRAYIQKNQVVSPSVKEVLCRQYFWDQQFAEKTMKTKIVLACSALRADIDCGAL